MDQRYALAIFPLFFVGLWIFVTSLLGLLSGWNRLQERFPDRDQIPIRRLRGQSGTMGGLLGLPINFNHCLRLDICPNGLRVGIMRILGPFQRPFLVPWNEISVTKRRWFFFFTVYRFAFGEPEAGALRLSGKTARAIAPDTPLKLPD